MKSLGILVGCAGLWLAAPAMACNEPLPGATATQAPSSEIEQLSRRFAALFMPMDITMDNSALVGAREFRRGAEQAEGGADFIAADPERYRFVEQAALAALRQCLERRLPDIHVLLANQAMTKFSANDLRRINAFYETDAAQAMMLAVSNTAQARTPPDAVDAEGNMRTVTGSDLERVVRETPMPSLTRQQQIAITLFFRSPAGLRLETEAPQLAQIIASGVNGINAQTAPILEQAAFDALAEWTAREEGAAAAGGLPK